jgi:hypothetical protein
MAVVLEHPGDLRRHDPGERQLGDLILREESHALDLVARRGRPANDLAAHEDLVEVVDVRRVPVSVAVQQGEQLRGSGLEARLLPDSRTTASAGESPTSALPPGSVHSPSERSWTKRIFPSRKTTPRTSTFGVAYPASDTSRWSTRSASNPAWWAIISAAMVRIAVYRSMS